MADAQRELLATVYHGLEQRGYGALLSSRWLPKTWSGLRPAVEAYTRFHELQRDQPLETLFSALQRPCCKRPDIDFGSDGLPVASEQTKPSARLIEAVLEDRVDPLERGVTFWTHEPIRVYWDFNKIPDGNDSFAKTRTTEEIWARLLHIAHNLCGVRFARVDSPSEANLTGSSRFLGPGVLGLAQVPSRGIGDNAQLWFQLNPFFDLSVLILLSTWIHEMWHNLGSPHLRGGLNFMSPSHLPQLRRPGPKDTEWSQRHYPLKGDEDPSDLDFIGWVPRPTPGPDPPRPPTPEPEPEPEPPGDTGGLATISIAEAGQLRVYQGRRIQ